MTHIRGEFVRYAGTQFDKKLAQSFLELIDSLDEDEKSKKIQTVDEEQIQKIKKAEDDQYVV